MSRDDRALALGLISSSAYPGAVATLAERVVRALGEARAEGYAAAVDAVRAVDPIEVALSGVDAVLERLGQAQP